MSSTKVCVILVAFATSPNTDYAKFVFSYNFIILQNNLRIVEDIGSNATTETAEINKKHKINDKSKTRKV